MRLPPSMLATLAAALLAATPASAGFWNWGCTGELSLEGYPGLTVMFDRNSLVIMPRELAHGDLKGITKDYITMYEAMDTIGGLKPSMDFERAGFPDQKLKLTQTSSKVVFEKHDKLGTRDRSQVISRRSYRLAAQLWNEQVDKPIAMQCMEFEVTAP